MARAVDPHVGPVNGPVVPPDALGLESVVRAAEAAEIVAGRVPAALGILVVERDDVVEVGFVCRGLTAGEDAGTVAAPAEAGQRLRGAVPAGGVSVRIREGVDGVEPSSGEALQLVG